MQAHTHLETQTHTHAVALSWSMRWLFDVCDAPAGLRRGPSYQRGRLQRSVHVEHMTALWPSGLQLLGSDDCNGDSSGRLCPPPPQKKLNKNADPRSFEVETAQKWWIVILQSSGKDA